VIEWESNSYFILFYRSVYLCLSLVPFFTYSATNQKLPLGPNSYYSRNSRIIAFKSSP